MREWKPRFTRSACCRTSRRNAGLQLATAGNRIALFGQASRSATLLSFPTFPTLSALLQAPLFALYATAGLAAVALAMGLWWIWSAQQRLRWPLYARRVLSAPELQLYDRLVRALPRQIVLAQVQVSRVLGVRDGFDFHEWNNRICRLSYDFVVCAPDGCVIAAIELDDSSHEHEDRIRADLKKNAATAAAGVPLIRWHVTAMPDLRAIQTAFKGLRPVRRAA